MLDYLVEELIAEPEFTNELRGEQLLELKCLELQEWEHERENQVKLKELELKEKEMAIQLKMRELESHSPVAPAMTSVKSLGFDVSKHVH